MLDPSLLLNAFGGFFEELLTIDVEFAVTSVMDD
jgi:hypothetical protein